MLIASRAFAPTTKAIVPLTLARQDFCIADARPPVATDDLTAPLEERNGVWPSRRAFKDPRVSPIVDDDQRAARAV